MNCSIVCVALSKPVGFSEREVPWPGNAILPWEHGLNVPGHDPIQECIKVHEDEAGGEVVVVFFHWAGEEVIPLDAHTLLFKQGEILTAKSKRHWRQ